MATAADEIGAAHGTTSGGVTLGVVGSGVGVPELAAAFDGLTGEINFGDVYDLDGVTPWTIEMMLKATVLPTAGIFPRVLDKQFTDGSGLQGYRIMVLPDLGAGEQGLLQFGRSVNGATVNCASVTKLSTTVWRHAAFTYDGTNMRCYVDGVLERTSAAATASVVAGLVSLLAGGRSGFDHFNGQMARLAVYPIALSVARIKTHSDIALGLTTSLQVAEAATFGEAWLMIGSWSDSFDDDSQSALWTRSQTTEFGGVSLLVAIAERNRRLEITPVPNTAGQQYNGYQAVNTNNLTDTYAQVEVQALSAGISRTIFAVVLDANNWYRFVSEAGIVYCQRKEAGVQSTPVSFAFSAVTHRYWRIEHNSGAAQIQWRTSTDGAAWTTRATWTPTIALTALKAELVAGSPSSMSGAGVALFDNFGWGVSLVGTLVTTDEIFLFNDDDWLVIPGEERASDETFPLAETWELSAAEHRVAELFPFAEGWAVEQAAGPPPAIFDIAVIDGDPAHRLTIGGKAHFWLRGYGDPALRLTVSGGQEG